MHRDYYPRPDLFYRAPEVLEFYRRRTPDQGQQDVHPTPKPMQLLPGERVACVSHMEDADSPQLEAVHRVLARILFVLDALHGPQGLKRDAPHLDRARSGDTQGVQAERIAGNHRGVRVIRIGRRADDPQVGRIIHGLLAGDRRIVRIRYDGHAVSFAPETRVSVPFYQQFAIPFS
jgi:hypothetical protein